MLKTLAITGLLVSSISAHAAIQDLGNITRDTATGLDWLDVTETRGLSYDQVIANINGGSLQGWRYATAEEFDQLVSSFGYSPIESSCSFGVTYCDDNPSGDSLIIELMVDTLGDTLRANYDESGNDNDIAPGGSGRTVGILGTYIPDPSISFFKSTASIVDGELIWRDSSLPYTDWNDRVQTVSNAVTTDSHAADYGSFLVRTSTVPVPAAAWLFGSALIGLVGLRRK